MPVFGPAIRGISLSDALKEAAAIAPITRVMVYTYELRHPAIETIRVVNGYDTFTATLEADAIEDPSASVDFLPLPLSINRAEESDASGAPEVQIDIDNVSPLMAQALAMARGTLDLWYVTERVYASDDLTGPAVLPPTTLTLKSAAISGAKITLTAGYGDPVNIGVPRLTFTREEYPSLGLK